MRGLKSVRSVKRKVGRVAMTFGKGVAHAAGRLSKEERGGLAKILRKHRSHTGGKGAKSINLRKTFWAN